MDPILGQSVGQFGVLGMEMAQVLYFLEQTSSAELPQNVRRSLEEWGALHERIVFRTGVSLLQAADSELLASLMDDAQLVWLAVDRHSSVLVDGVQVGKQLAELAGEDTDAFGG